MSPYIPDPRLSSILQWMVIGGAAALIVHFAVRAAVVNGTQMSLNLKTVLFLGTAAIISAACTVGALRRFGPLGMIGWIFASVLIGGAFAARSTARTEREQWLRQEKALVDSLTAGGFIVGSMAAAFLLKLFHFF